MHAKKKALGKKEGKKNMTFTHMVQGSNTYPEMKQKTKTVSLKKFRTTKGMKQNLETHSVCEQFVVWRHSPL